MSVQNVQLLAVASGSGLLSEQLRKTFHFLPFVFQVQTTNASKHDSSRFLNVPFFFKWKCLFIYIWKRESKWRKSTERRRERERDNPKQAVCFQCRAGWRAWSHKLWNHHLSWNQELDAQPTEPPRRPQTCLVFICAVRFPPFPKARMCQNIPLLHIL